LYAVCSLGTNVAKPAATVGGGSTNPDYFDIHGFVQVHIKN
jgi:hypothetical protein